MFNQLANKILAYVMVPPLAVSLAVLICFAFLQAAQTRALQQEKFALAEQLIATHDGAFTNPHRFNALAQTLLSIKPLRSVSLFDANRQLMASEGLPSKAANFLGDKPFNAQVHQWRDGDTLYRMIPVGKPANGWVVLEMAPALFSIMRYQSVIFLLIVVGMAMVVTLYFANKLKRLIIQPLQQLQRSLQEYLAGNLANPMLIKENSGFQEMADTLGKLVKKQRLEQDAMHSYLEEYTQDLRETLETMEIRNIKRDIARKGLLQPGQIEAELPHELSTPLNHITLEREDYPPPPTNELPKILAVDDNAANLRLVHELLKGMNVEVKTATNGGEALTICALENFDLILMDIQMPGMDGLETTRQLRQQEGEGTGRRTPIVALSADDVNAQKTRLLTAGMDDYLGKPVSDRHLRHVIDRWITSTTDNVRETAPAIFDRSEALEKVNHKRDLARDMLTMLVDSLPETVQTITRARQSEDIKALQEIVHKLCGGCFYCGVPALNQAASRLHTMLQQEEHDELDEETDVLLARIAELETWAGAQSIDELFQ